MHRLTPLPTLLLWFSDIVPARSTAENRCVSSMDSELNTILYAVGMKRTLWSALSLAVIGSLGLVSSCSSAAETEDPSVTGRRLVTEFLTILVSEDRQQLDDFLADGFQLQRADGSGATKSEYLDAPAKVTAFSIGDDLTAVRDGDLLTVRWSVEVEETVAGSPLSGGNAPRLSVFVWGGDRWQMIAHANFNLPA